MHLYSCLQTPPRENWFQYVRREYATAIKLPCLITLFLIIYLWFSGLFQDLNLNQFKSLHCGHRGDRGDRV